MAEDTFPILGIDHVRFYVNNARQNAYFYQHAFGFDIVGYGGLETGLRHEVDYVLKQGNTRFLFSAPVRPGHPMADKIAQHGDFVQDIAFLVEDVDWSF